MAPSNISPQIDCGDPPTAGAKGGGDKRGETDGSASEEQGGEQGSLNTPSISVPGSEAGAPILRDKTNHPLSAPPPPPPPPLAADTVLSSITETQTESRDGAISDIGPYSFGEGKEKADTGDGQNGDGHNGDGDKRDGDRAVTGATVVTGIRDSCKRTADNAGLNQGGEAVPRSAKVQCTDPADNADDADKDMSDLEFARLRLLPKPVFKRPPLLRSFQQYENATSSSRSSGAGDSQDHPLAIDDDGGKTGDSGASTRATSIEPQTGTAHLLSSHPREEPKTLGDLNASTASDPPTESLDQPTSPDVALPYRSDGRAVGEDNYGVEAVASPPSASTPILPQ